MPWRDDAKAGFTDGTPWLPVAVEHLAQNVVAQDANHASVLNATRAFLQWRKTQHALVEGDIAFLDAPEPILAFVRRHGDRAMLVAFNLSEREVEWTLPMHADATPIEAPGVNAGSIRNGRMVLPARGVLYASA